MPRRIKLLKMGSASQPNLVTTVRLWPVHCPLHTPSVLGSQSPTLGIFSLPPQLYPHCSVTSAQHLLIQWNFLARHFSRLVCLSSVFQWLHSSPSPRPPGWLAVIDRVFLGPHGCDLLWDWNYLLLVPSAWWLTQWHGETTAVESTLVLFAFEPTQTGVGT